ncbi:MAG: T9SS type A sorting domain-containing protein [Candidatus Kapabacteria bacterium]|nr:T9SS type A sorting domain-containing protein [Candidatus Kapabacteria bacterium]
MNSRTILSLLLLAAASLPLYAQPVVEPITQNPDAVLLRRIWTITGNDGDRVGQGCGPVGDINGDSITDFAVQYGIEQCWKVFLGGSPVPSPVPIASIPSLAPYPAFPVYGYFYGDNRLLVGFGSHTFKSMNGTSIGFYQLKLYQPDVEHGLSKEPVMIVEPDPDMSVPLLLIAPSAAIAMNIDGQRGDELLLALNAVRRGDSVYKRPEYWFYRGGSGFQVDTPDYVVRDPEEATDAQFYTAKLLDIDGDRYIDLLSVAKYAEGFKLKMWFGTETSPWTWTQPDREILLDDSSGLNYHMAVGDFDGDKMMDFAGTAGRDATRGTYIYRSRSGKSVRSRTFARSDAEQWFPNLDQYTVGIAGSLLNTTAYFNDSSQRVIMLRLQSAIDGQTRMSLFSGSRIGPNGAVDGYYSSGIDGLANKTVEGYGGRLPDCTGDGWDDLITSSPRWPGDYSGIGVILAGGPYIPLDQPTVSVRTEPMANHQRGLYLWPNPATTELNLAWRGDLATMPTRFSIHDIAGKLITENEIRPERGAARWSTAAVPSGTYLLTAYDRSGKVLASTQILVQH